MLRALWMATTSTTAATTTTSRLLLPRRAVATTPTPADNLRRGGVMFDKILVANRGEIACRVMRTARDMGVRTVAVFSEADRLSQHVELADEAFCIGPAAAAESYLRAERVLDVARRTGAQALHPGYGFLSENAAFSQACAAANVKFIGPPASAITAMGSKSASKEIMSRAGVPVVPGYHGDDQSLERLRAESERIGYPVMLKAWMGGGGKGMRIVERAADLEESLASCKREAQASFGDDRVLVEKYLVDPRHVELQVFCDAHGNAVYLFERDCSVQRRHQKVIEEAPAPGMSEEKRREMGEAAVAAARAVGYENAGTVEFIFDPASDAFYFMEMNTRLQVEHPITEMITGQDLVRWQLMVAAGAPLPLEQSALSINGHAFESRIYAENPDKNFLPGTGRLVHMRTPHADGKRVRIDTGVRQGDEVSIFYDPMIAKLIVHADDRAAALRAMRNALEEYQVAGLHTNTAFLRRLCEHPAFIDGRVHTGFIEQHSAELLVDPSAPVAIDAPFLVAAALHATVGARHTAAGAAASTLGDPLSPWAQLDAFRVNGTHTHTHTFVDASGNEHTVRVARENDARDLLTVTVGETAHRVVLQRSVGDDLVAFVDDKLVEATVVEHDASLHVFYNGASHTFELPAPTWSAAHKTEGSLVAPMHGKIIKVMCAAGDAVVKGQPLLIMEAMKMEHTIRAVADGIVELVHYAVDDLVEEKKVLVALKDAE